MLLPTLFVAYLFRIVAAATNITVDDNSPSITYHPAFSWKETPFDPLNFGGQHRVTSNPNATATFNFTGVAIYFYSPLWPFQVNTAISIDGQSPVFVDLTDYTQTPFVVDGPETVASDVVWDATGLDNKEHTLVVSVALGQQHAVVDGLVYTVPDPDDVTTTSESAAPTTTTSLLPIPSSTQTPAAASSTSPGARRGLSIALGIVCTTFALLVAWAAYWYWKRRRRLAAEEEFYQPRTDGPPPEMSSVPPARPKYVRTRPIENPFLAPSSSSSSSSSTSSSRRHRPPRPKVHLSTIPETRDDSRPTSASYNSRTRVSSPLRNQVDDDDTSDDQDRDFPQPSVRLVSHS